MKRYFREIFGEDVERAVREVNEWGYPTPEFAEGDSSIWITHGPGVYFWICISDLPDAAFHVCIDPAHRKRTVSRDWLHGVRAIAEFLGASRFVLCVEPEIANYLMRSGAWTDHGHDWYSYELGEDAQ